MFGLALPAWAAQLLVRAGIALGVMIAGAVVWTYCPVIGPHAVQARLSAHLADAQSTAADWKRAAQGWEASFRKSEAIRSTETAQARSAVDDDATACNARVAEARRSAGKLKALLSKEPTIDPATHCTNRALVDAGGLRDALQPGGAR